MLPWLGQTLSAPPTTTTRATSSTCARPTRTSPTCSRRVNEFFATDIVPEDIAGAYAGVRPLISTGDPKKSVDISRKAELYETSSGMVTITGGKLTTWRRMAKMTVDRLVERDGREAPCRTGEIPLGMPVDANELARVEGVAGGRLRAARGPLRLRGPRRAQDRRRARRAGPADPARHARPAGRGGLLGAPRAGAQRQRRAAAAHPPRADRRAAAVRARRAGARARRAGARGRAGLGRGSAARPRPSASAPTPWRRGWWWPPRLPSGPGP